MKIILSNEDIKEAIAQWAERKFAKTAEVKISNKRNGVEVTVDLIEVAVDLNEQNTKAFSNVEESLIETGCCGAVTSEVVSEDLEEHN